MTDNQILAGAERQAQLEAAKSAFFASGGTVVVVDGCAFMPPPARVHPASVKTPAVTQKQGLNTARKAAQERDEKIAALSETMTCGQIAEAMGLSSTSVRGICRKLGVKPLRAPPGREARPRSEFTAMAERVDALSKIGVSRTQAFKHLGITHQTLSRIIDEFGIDFPPQRAKK